MKPCWKTILLPVPSLLLFLLAASGQAPSDDEKGKQLIDETCASCHAPSGWVHTKEDWELIVPDMAAKGGASPSQSEINVMVAYLSRHFGTGEAASDTPAKSEDQASSEDEKGQKLLDQVCVSCHDAAGWMHTKGEWEAIVPDHASRGGSTLTEDQLRILVGYLTKHFGSR